MPNAFLQELRRKISSSFQSTAKDVVLHSVPILGYKYTGELSSNPLTGSGDVKPYRLPTK